MGTTVHIHEGDLAAFLLVHRLEFEGLIDRHLDILISVDEQQGWIVFVDMRHRTGEASQPRGFYPGVEPRSSSSAGTRTPNPCGVLWARMVSRFAAP